MSTAFHRLAEEARLAARALSDFGNGLIHPTCRLGVTGLTRSGKTVFITSLVHNLITGGELPVFDAMSGGRVWRVRLAPQPDDAVPRFDYEGHLAALLSRDWPESTSRISELRLIIDYQSAGGRQRTLTLDIVDYPGEWLLDLPLLQKSYRQWSGETLARSREGPRAAIAIELHRYLKTLQPNAKADEQAALQAARFFTAYLMDCRAERLAMSLLPPGRFLMPGDLAGSPALTFAPLDLPASEPIVPGSLAAMMERRYDAYKSVVVRPFFRDHFARLDRQIVLVDMLASLNAGPAALGDLESALAEILSCLRIGRKTWLSSVLHPRIDRVLFAATKADHLHHLNHDRLEATLSRLVEQAASHIDVSGARMDVIALAAVRSTREAFVAHEGERLPTVVGVPLSGERLGSDAFDGVREAAAFPGDLPGDPVALFGPQDGRFQGSHDVDIADADYRFVRFRPPPLPSAAGTSPALPHIRLDRALEFLLGDRLA